MRRATIVLALAALLAGCGSGGHDDGTGGVVNGTGDSATFVVDGTTVTVRQSGTASVTVDGAPEIAYDGPVGCGGQFFTAKLHDLNVFFHYGARDAYLLVGSELYYLGGAPERRGGQLEWQTTTNDHQIDVRADCPPPKPGPSLAPKSGIPPACSLLTPALARQAVGRRVGKPESLQINPELSYCKYESVSGGRSVAVSVTTAEQLIELASWAQPPVAGVGEEAHGGGAGEALAVRQGKLGIEVTVGLGFGADDAGALAAEKALAAELLK